MKLKTHFCAVLVAALAVLTLPASAYTAYKTVSFGPDQTGQAVTYTIKNGAGATVTSGVSGMVIELGGGSYASLITVPDGAGYFVTWLDANGGSPLVASDVIAAPVDTSGLAAALAGISTTTTANSTTINTINTKLGVPAGISFSADLLAIKVSADAGTATNVWANSNRSLTDKVGFRTLDSLNKYTYNPNTRKLQKLKDDGSPMDAPLTLSTDSAGNILSRQ